MPNVTGSRYTMKLFSHNMAEVECNSVWNNLRSGHTLHTTSGSLSKDDDDDDDDAAEDDA